MNCAPSAAKAPCAGKASIGTLSLIGALLCCNDQTGTLMADRWLDHGRPPHRPVRAGAPVRPRARNCSSRRCMPAPASSTRSTAMSAGMPAPPGRCPDWGKISVIRYDNEGDPAAKTSRDTAWDTRFWSVGARTNIGPVVLIAQGMRGSTIVAGPGFVATTNSSPPSALPAMTWTTGASACAKTCSPPAAPARSTTSGRKTATPPPARFPGPGRQAPPDRRTDRHGEPPRRICAGRPGPEPHRPAVPVRRAVFLLTVTSRACHCMKYSHTIRQCSTVLASRTTAFRSMSSCASRSWRLIGRGVLKPGSQLPTMRQVAVALKIDLNTVQRAYAELERDGVLTKLRGVGTFVTESAAAAAQQRAPPGAGFRLSHRGPGQGAGHRAGRTGRGAGAAGGARRMNHGVFSFVVVAMLFWIVLHQRDGRCPQGAEKPDWRQSAPGWCAVRRTSTVLA